MVKVAVEYVSYKLPVILTTLRRQQLTADAFNKARIMKNVMGRMGTALQKANKRERALVAYTDGRDLALMRKSFNVWLALERGNLLQRVLDTRKVRTLFSKWKGKKERVENLNGG